jgi:hypothetical protein
VIQTFDESPRNKKAVHLKAGVGKQLSNRASTVVSVAERPDRI